MCFIFFYYYTTIYATADQDCPGYFLVSLGSRLYFWDHQPKLGERMFSWEKIAAAIARVQKNDFFLVNTLMANELNLKMHYIYIRNININYPLSITYIYIISRFTNHFIFFLFYGENKENVIGTFRSLFVDCSVEPFSLHSRGGGTWEVQLVSKQYLTDSKKDVMACRSTCQPQTLSLLWRIINSVNVISYTQ